MTGVVVIGVGNPFRRDDGVGAAVIDALRRRLESDLLSEDDLLVLDGEPARLLEAWDGAEVAVVIDACRSGAGPGAVRVLEWVEGARCGQERPEAEPGTSGAGGTTSSHRAGVAEAVALGSALGRLPGWLVLYGVEGCDFGDGPGLSVAVEAAVEEIADEITALVRSPAWRSWTWY